MTGDIQVEILAGIFAVPGACMAELQLTQVAARVNSTIFKLPLSNGLLGFNRLLQTSPS